MSDLTKISFNAIPKTVVCLEGVAATTGDTETDSLNRAVQFYAFACAAIDSGDRLILLHPNGEAEEVTLR